MLKATSTKSNQITSNTGLGRFPEANEVDVLFVTYGGGHCRMVLPVAKELERRGLRVCIFAMTTAIAPVRESGLAWFSYANLPDAHETRVQARGTQLSASFPVDGPVPIEDSIAYMGVNYCDLETAHGVGAAQALYHEHGRFVFHPTQTMLNMLRLVQPRVLVATNSPRSERAAIDAAGIQSIASLCMVDMFALQEKEWIKDPGYATKVSVLNASVRDMLVKNGRLAQDVIVTGNPAFDQLLTSDVIVQGREMRAKRAWGQAGRRVLLYASAPESPTDPYTGEPADLELPLKVEQVLKDIVTQDDSLELVIRRHPSEKQNVSLSERIFQSTMDDDIDELLHAVDIVIVTCSTVGFQGYLAGRPVLSVECSVVSRDAPYEAFGISRAAKTLADIPETLTRALDQPRSKTHESKATAVDSVSDLIVQLAQD